MPKFSVTPVILSGGAGTRLWPLSREMYPKQLLALTSKQTMLQDTAARLAAIAGAIAPIVVCNEAHRFTVAEQLRALGAQASAILLEPAGRTARDVEPRIDAEARVEHAVEHAHGRRAARQARRRRVRHRPAPCAPAP